jgi:hypothetical protein
MDERQQIVQEILRVANEIAPATITRKVFCARSSISASRIRYYFGTWNNAVAAAGLPVNSDRGTRAVQKLTDDELLVAIGDLWKSVGRRPTADLMNSHGRFSVRPYNARWGTFRAAIDQCIARFGEPDTQTVAVPDLTKVTPAKSANLVIPKTHKPRTDVSPKPIVFVGEPLGFRGLQYAPVNEQGVVYLFGIVSRELGFLVESVRIAFPDCEGKRCLNPAQTKWQHVRIEFEYRSSNFLEHGHNPDGCDLIVCWLHDWEECPVEVLELKSALRQLPRQ